MQGLQLILFCLLCGYVGGCENNWLSLKGLAIRAVIIFGAIIVLEILRRIKNVERNS